MILYKYQGAGNDFLIADNRAGTLSLTPADISALCDRRYGIGADGVMLLESAPAASGYDFRMVYYNSDGSGGMMCGNGGRCIVAFAYRCGVGNAVSSPTLPFSYDFIAADGPHHAEILSVSGKEAIVKLGMKDVDHIDMYTDPAIDGCFMDTGTRHLVCPVSGISTYDVFSVGRAKRYMPQFGPVGVNVNFIEPQGPVLHVRTYEKGVEDETYACGTGITASAIAYWHYRNARSPMPLTDVHQPIRALRDDLAVDFTPTPDGAVDVYLTGPATYVAQIDIDI